MAHAQQAATVAAAPSSATITRGDRDHPHPPTIAGVWAFTQDRDSESSKVAVQASRFLRGQSERRLLPWVRARRRHTGLGAAGVRVKSTGVRERCGASRTTEQCFRRSRVNSPRRSRSQRRRVHLRNEEVGGSSPLTFTPPSARVARDPTVRLAPRRPGPLSPTRTTSTTPTVRRARSACSPPPRSLPDGGPGHQPTHTTAD